MTDVLIKRELLERLAGNGPTSTLSATRELRAILAAQPVSDDVRDALAEALEEVTASLEWNAHGICRGINDGPIMPSSMAVEFAIKTLAAYRAAQEKK